MSATQKLMLALCLQRKGIISDVQKHILEMTRRVAFPFCLSPKRNARRAAKSHKDGTTCVFSDEYENGMYVFNEAVLVNHNVAQTKLTMNPYHYGSCLMGSGLYIDVIYPNKRKAKEVLIVDFPSDGYALALNETVEFLNSKGIFPRYLVGVLD